MPDGIVAVCGVSTTALNAQAEPTVTVALAETVVSAEVEGDERIKKDKKVRLKRQIEALTFTYYFLPFFAVFLVDFLLFSFLATLSSMFCERLCTP